jgi:excinuclease ABC subunit C
MGIKGISEKKAKALIKKFGSLMEIGEATVDEISEIKGFGKTLASRLIEVLNSEEKIEV